MAGLGKGRIRFGLDDPYYTGQILEGASLVYPFIYKSLDLEPVFDEKCLEAEGNFKGRVRVSYLLWLFWGSLSSQTYLEDDTGFFRS